MLKKLIAGLSLSVMMVGCNSVNISEKDVNGYLGKHATNSFNLSYVRCLTQKLML
ncbi:hypothetical protein I3271_01555 [Photobacterium leiognathi]|uniref:hypothetical protein n=1 Tax=Photobacterium leiognathi TaxID=553611 RepID=UPI001EDD828B|nr:hypothetical protein [Photobacterium leiognathi]MCG3883365.1 hypothetical protein [Photobacterium leiognathi]